MILFDLSNIFYRVYYLLERKYNEDVIKYGVAPFVLDHNTLLKAILREVKTYEDKFKSFYGRAVLCCDSRDNWRYEYFKEYKQTRKENKEQDCRDWDQIMTEYNKVKEMLSENSHYTVLEIEGLEADDIISLAVRDSKDYNLIMSIDKDLNQLINDKTKQFSTVANDFMKREDHPLNEAILTGDNGDGVPNIFSDDDHFVKSVKVRAKPVSAKIKEFFSTYDVLTEDAINNFITFYNSKNKEPLDSEKVMHNFKRNKLMIDLGCVPEKYKSVFDEEMKNNTLKAYSHSEKWVDEVLGIEHQEDENIGDLL